MEVIYTGTLDEAAGHLAEQAGVVRDNAEHLRTAAQRDAATARAGGLDEAVGVLRHWQLPESGTQAALASVDTVILDQFAFAANTKGAPQNVLDAIADAAKVVREWQGLKPE